MASELEEFSSTPADVQEINYSNWTTAYGIILTNGTKSVTVDTANSQLKLDCHSNWGSNGAVTAYHSVTGAQDGIWKFHVNSYGAATYGQVMTGVIQIDDDENMVYIENVHHQNAKIWVRANDSGAPVKETSYTFSSRPYWKIQKSGQVWTVYHSANGTDWTQEWSDTLTQFSANTTWFLVSGGLAGWGDTIYIYIDYWSQEDLTPFSGYGNSNLKTLIQKQAFADAGFKSSIKEIAYADSLFKSEIESLAMQDIYVKTLIEKTVFSDKNFSAKIGLIELPDALVKTKIELLGLGDSNIKALVQLQTFSDALFKSEVEISNKHSDLPFKTSVEYFGFSDSTFKSIIELQDFSDMEIKTSITFAEQSDLQIRSTIEHKEFSDAAFKADINFGNHSDASLKSDIELPQLSDTIFRANIIGINFADVSLKSKIRLVETFDALLKTLVEIEPYNDRQFKTKIDKDEFSDSEIKTLVEISNNNEVPFKTIMQKQGFADSVFKTSIFKPIYSGRELKTSIIRAYYKDLFFRLYVEPSLTPAEKNALERILEERWNLT